MKLKDKDFAARLAIACEQCSFLPDKGNGRQLSIAQKLKVSPEAVSKWFTGESRPRPRLMKELASFLRCDLGWLSFNLKSEISPQNLKMYSKRMDGVVHLALGMSMLEGGVCARPSEADPRKELVDFYTIIDGEQIPLKASLGMETSDGSYEFMVPKEYTEVRNLGFVYQGLARIHMIDLESSLIAKHKSPKNGDFCVKVKARGRAYFSGADEWPIINSVKELVS